MTSGRFAIAFALVLAVGSAGLRADVPKVLQQPGVLYLGDNLPQPIFIKLDKPVRAYFDRDFSSIAGTYSQGTELRLVGVAGTGYLVTGPHRGSPLQAWVKIADVPTVDPAILREAEAHKRKQDEIDAAIADKRVVEGMNFDQVRKSLGRPDEASFREEVGKGRIDTWNYITYELVPRTVYVPSAYGGYIIQTVYDKIPNGELAVEFLGGGVVAIEEHVKASSRSSGINVPLQPTVPQPN